MNSGPGRRSQSPPRTDSRASSAPRRPTGAARSASAAGRGSNAVAPASTAKTHEALKTSPDNVVATPDARRQRVEVPVVEERLIVGKREIETGQVVVHIEPKVEKRVLDVPLVEEMVEIERVAVNRFIDGPVPVRNEGDVTIVPVFEEVLVVEKRLMLKEEIRLVRRKVQTHERQTYALRKEEVHILRSDAKSKTSSEGTGIALATPSAADGQS